jgi:hypothetical protein
MVSFPEAAGTHSVDHGTCACLLYRGWQHMNISMTKYTLWTCVQRFRMSIYLRLRMSIYLRLRMSIYLRLRMSIYLRLRMSIYLRLRMSIYQNITSKSHIIVPHTIVCMYTCMCACTYVCTYIRTHIRTYALHWFHGCLTQYAPFCRCMYGQTA